MPDTSPKHPLDLTVLDTFIATVGTQPILDAGCGAGRISRYIADRGGRVVGVDLSPEMIAQGQARHLTSTCLSHRSPSCRTATRLLAGCCSGIPRSTCPSETWLEPSMRPSAWWRRVAMCWSRSSPGWGRATCSSTTASTART
ncbi:class I SAM-dependent methyltransferase [Ornithinimicrobium ciconiae]|uniref:Class I SAM-dependent methyltransferase n=1 Tax=Ornithinimicrobium ciconiae TaxID=2594265 RepID=A0A516GF24_9MICO|nr:class I SAM-dependent methyltransferase [Ornithinimicrobium ciconiae]